MKLLDRALEKIPELSLERSDFVIPSAETFIQGNKTMLKNISGIANTARRQIEEISRYLTRELGVPISSDGQQLIISGRFSDEEINKHIKRYFEVFVICRECHKPDTHTEPHGRGMSYVICEACGAHYGVKN